MRKLAQLGALLLLTGVASAQLAPCSPLPDVGACSTDGTKPCPKLNSFVPFGSANLWNTRIDTAPVDPNSAMITSTPTFGGHLHHDFGSNFGYPFIVVDSSTQPLVPIQLWYEAPPGGRGGLEPAPDFGESDNVVVPFPFDAPIEGNGGSPGLGCPNISKGDSHVLALDRHTCTLYETWLTHICGGGTYFTAAQETMFYAAGGSGDHMNARPIGWTSADASGSSMYAGIIKYDEVASGHIDHALRFTMSYTKNDTNGGYWVLPASHPAGTNWGTPNVMGMRIRLKATFDISKFSKTNQVILTAMKEYGMILADNGGNFFFQGVPDPRWSDADLINLDMVDGPSNFEVVQTTPKYPGYTYTSVPTGKAPKINSFAASVKSVSAGGSVTFTYATTGDTYDYIDNAGVGPAGSGSITISPKATAAYTLYSANTFGRTHSKPITVSVTDAAAK